MRNDRLWAKSIALGSSVTFVALVLPGLSHAQQPVGVVTGLQGQAQLTRPAVPPAPLRFKDGLIIRDIVDTREKSLARILFGGRSTVTVRELTRLEVREEILPTGQRRDVHELSSGAILVNVARQLMRPGDEVIIRTPNAVAAVRGSLVFALYDALLQQTIFAVLFGSIFGGPLGLPPIVIAANTALNITGTGPAAQVTQTTVTQAQATQILQESQIGKVVTEEGNKQQIAQTETETAANLATAVVEAITGAAPTTTAPAGTQDAIQDTAAATSEVAATTITNGLATATTPSTETVTTAPVAPDTSIAVDKPDVEISSSSKTLKAGETFKTFSGSSSRSGSSPVARISNSTVSGAGNLFDVDPGADASLASPLLEVTDSTITGSRILEVEGTLKSSTKKGFIAIDPSTINTPDDFITIGAGGSLSLEGQLLTDVGGIFDISKRLLHVRDGSTLTSKSPDPLFQFSGSTVSTSSGTIAVSSLTAQLPPTLTLSGPLLSATNNTSITASNPDLGAETFLFVGDSAKLTGPPKPLVGDAPALTSFTNSTLTATGNFFTVRRSLTPGTPTTAELGGPLAAASGSTFTVANFIAVSESGKLTGTGTTPLIQSNPSTFDISSNFIRIDDSSDAAVNPGTPGPATVMLASALISDTGSTFSITNRFLLVRDGSTFTSTSTEPLIQLTSSTVDTGNNFFTAFGATPAAVNLNGPLLAATNTNFTTGDPALNRRSFLIVTDTSTLTNTAIDPLVTFNTSTLDTAGNFLTISDSKATASTVSLAGPLLKATGSTFKSFSTFQVAPGSNCCSFIFLSEKSKLESSGATPLLQFTNSNLDVGSSFLTLTNVNDFSPGTPAPSTMTLAGPLVSDTGSTFNTGSRFLSVTDGSTLTSTSTDHLIHLTGSTVNTKNDFLLLLDSGSKIALSGSLLSAGSTLNIGTDPTLFGDLLDVRAPAQLVMNSSNPVVLFTGGTHTVGTDDVTANDTVNRLFRFSGVNTDGTTGLGTDQPIKGNGVDPAPFTGASNPIGGLLKATEGATIEVKKGAGDTSGGNAVRFDTMLYEATAPVIELIGSATKDTSLKTADTTMDIFRSKVVSNGPLVALDKGLIDVQNGPFIHIRSGSNVDVKADLLKLFNGSKIEVINGPLIKVEGTSATGTASMLNVTGALVNFGGSGNNKIIVNNTLCGGACAVKSTIQVLEGSANSITIGPNPIKNPGLGNIQVNANSTAVIQTGATGTVNITAP